jgi:GntR family histidine utilization transcriptional repressor
VVIGLIRSGQRRIIHIALGVRAVERFGLGLVQRGPGGKPARQVRIGQEQLAERHRIGVAVRKHLDNSVHTYRIPALGTSSRGTLLCVYDIRRSEGRDLQEDIESRGHRHEARVQLHRAEPATSALGEQLGLALGAPVFHTLILHLEDGRPLQCEDRYVNPLAAPGYLAEDFTRITPTRYLFGHTALRRAQYTLEAATATAQEAELLQIAPQAPCLIMVRRTMSHNQVITLARLVHPGERYQLSGEFNP